MAYGSYRAKRPAAARDAHVTISISIPRTKTEFARRSYSYSASFVWKSTQRRLILQLGTYFQETFKDISF